jgi:predicted small lipoprotein YifL
MVPPMSAEPFSSRPFLRLAVIGALCAALGLAACGRKGPLDPPPGASFDNGAATPISGAAAPDGSTGVGRDGMPLAPRGPRKPIPLDVLLN